MVRKEKPAIPRVFTGVVVLLVVVVAALILQWLACGGAGYFGAEDDLEATDNDEMASVISAAAGMEGTNRAAVALARMNAVLAEAALREEQLAELRTLAEVARSTPHRSTPSPERIRVLQHGVYADLHAELGEVLGQPLTDEVKPYGELSRAEMLLLYSDWVGTDYLDDPAYLQVISRMNSADIPFVPDLDAYGRLWSEDDRRQLLTVYELVGGESARLQSRLSEDWLPRFASPVTRKLFEPWHEQWSAGQGYIAEVREPAERSRLAKAIVRWQTEQGRKLMGGNGSRELLVPAKPDDDGSPEGAMSAAKFYYFRLYGEEPGSVIAEGILQTDNYQVMQRRWGEPAGSG